MTNTLAIGRAGATAVGALVFALLLAGHFAVAQVPAGNASAAGQRNRRSELLAEAGLPKPVKLPLPHASIALPDNWDQTDAPVTIRLSQAAGGELSVRRVSRNDGRLYLEIRSLRGPLSGTAEVLWAGKRLGVEQLEGSVWLSLKPRIGRIRLLVSSEGTSAPVPLIAPTTLVEIRGRHIFLNGEIFLMKGAMGRSVTEADAAYIHSLGLNTLRGLDALDACERYGFMNIASLNSGKAVPKVTMTRSDAEFEPAIGKCLEWLKESSPPRVASPYTLILQLGNESTGGGQPPGVGALTRAQRHAAQMLAIERNFIKPLAPMLPVGYANQDLGFLAPDCLDVYMHNSFLHKDRYNYSWQEFLRWQGCLPPDGPAGEGRPFVNSEFGANRYLCQAYLAGPNNPFLEKLHAWNLPCRWHEFMEHGTVGGCIYCLHDLKTPHDQGCSRFGILTDDGKPKLACWEVGHLWRDFEITVRDRQLQISYKRDYWARDCRLTLTPLAGQPLTCPLDDFAPRSARTLALSALSLGKDTNGFRWALDFRTHSGLTNQAAGAWPAEVEEADFLDRLKPRDTFPFLKELFDAQVLTADARPAPPTLAEMRNRDGIIPVALRKRNGVTYLLLITRETPNANGALRDGVTIDVAFNGSVVKVDDLTGKPLADTVIAEPTAGGLRLRNIRAARIPGPIGQRSKIPFALPIYRISP